MLVGKTKPKKLLRNFHSSLLTVEHMYLAVACDGFLCVTKIVHNFDSGYFDHSPWFIVLCNGLKIANKEVYAALLYFYSLLMQYARVHQSDVHYSSLFQYILSINHMKILVVNTMGPRSPVIIRN